MALSTKNIRGLKMKKCPLLYKRRLTLKRKFLCYAQRTLYFSGLASVFQMVSVKREHAAVLMYHSVVDSKLAPYIDPDNTISVEEFESHIRFLKNKCNVISMETLVLYLNKGQPLPRKSVVITFDDGYLDNLTLAAPILEKYELPATVFICTGYVERGDSQWIDEIYSIFSFRRQHQLQINNQTFDLLDRGSLQHAYDTVKGLLIDADYDTRKLLLNRIKDQLNPDLLQTPRLTLNWKEVQQLKTHFPLIEIGLHTRDHLNLTALSEKEIKKEIRQCQKDYESALGSKAKYFSYPYGLHNSFIRKTTKELGLHSSLAVYPVDLVSHSSNLMSIPRLTANDSLLDMKLWMSGAFPALSIKLFGRAYG
jgi:peptidoglycan/xylan/chitin deacetylase (PgdA/CDA1 family)